MTTRDHKEAIKLIKSDEMTLKHIKEWQPSLYEEFRAKLMIACYEDADLMLQTIRQSMIDR